MEKSLLAVGLMMLLSATVYLTNTTENSDSMNMANLYAQWKVKYQKKFSTDREELYRFKVFSDTVNMIKEFYESPEEHTYTLTINQFADLTKEEFASTYLNLQVPENRIKSESTNATYKPKANYINWVEKGYVPAVKNQGSCGSCWAFAAVGTLEINTRIYFGEVWDLSEQDLVDCAGSYGNYGCNGGWMDSAFQYVRDRSLATGNDYPYTAVTQSCRSVNRYYNRVQSQAYVDLNSCEEIENAIQGQTVSVAVDASNWSYYGGGVFNNCGTSLNHGVILVGVDWNGNWRVRNSWSAGWGEAGYITLSAGNTCGICYAASYPVLG